MGPLSAAELRARLARVRLLTLDTDGVLTDGGLYYTESGEELRRFDVKDGLGIKRVQAAGVAVVILSSSGAPAIAHRGRALGVDRVFLEVEDKLAQVSDLCDRLGIDLAEVAHVGDDLTDLALLGAVGVPLTVAGAVEEVRARAYHVTERPGGGGAVREVCDLIVAARDGAGQDRAPPAR